MSVTNVITTEFTHDDVTIITTRITLTGRVSVSVVHGGEIFHLENMYNSEMRAYVAAAQEIRERGIVAPSPILLGDYYAQTLADWAADAA